MAVDRGKRGGFAGISLGGILVIIGIVVALIWSFWFGVIVALIGLVAFGGFARGSGTSRETSTATSRAAAPTVAPTRRRCRSGEAGSRG